MHIYNAIIAFFFNIYKLRGSDLIKQIYDT